MVIISVFKKISKYVRSQPVIALLHALYCIFIYKQKTRAQTSLGQKMMNFKDTGCLITVYLKKMIVSSIGTEL